MSRAVARRGLAAGRASRPFAPADLLAALLRPPRTVYVELDAEGRLVAAGAGGGAGGGAGVAAGARLAPHVHARSAALELRDGAGAGGTRVPAALRVRTERALAPHEELLLWPDDALARAARLPYLTPRNILGGAGYECSACGARFEHPNPLKVHVYLSCAAPAHPERAFWRRLLASLPPAPAPPPALAPAELEALAAAWGRAPAGHVCLYCGKLYSRKYGLKIHIRTHTGYKPLRCRHCARAFGDPSNLNKHVRLHASPPAAAAAAPARHACAQCGAALARRRDLERHVRARHAAAPSAGAR